VRIQLDTNGAGGPQVAGQSAPAPASGKPEISPLAAASVAAGNAGANLRDTVAVSGASGAWANSFSDRAAKIGQLASVVQNGTYQVPCAAISQALVANAFA
jgi:hypothetical protein